MMKNYILKCLILLSIYVMQISCSTTEVIQTTIPTASSISTQTSATEITSILLSTPSHTIVTSEITTISSTGSSLAVSTVTISSAETSLAVSTTTISSAETSLAVSTATSVPNVVYNLTLTFSINSLYPLKTGYINDSTVIQSVLNMTRAFFNSSSKFTISIISIQINQFNAKSKNNRINQSQEKQSNLSGNLNYTMETLNQFSMNVSNCSAVCINATRLSSPPSQVLQLLSANNTQVSVTVVSEPVLSDPSATTTTSPATTTTMNYGKGESPPGKSAQLGMGLGITFIAVLIIAEILFLSRKYGHHSPMRQSHYELPDYH